MILVYFLLGVIAAGLYLYLTGAAVKPPSPKCHRSSRRAQCEERVKKPPSELQQPDLFAQFLTTEVSRENSPCNSKKNYVPPLVPVPEVAPVREVVPVQSEQPSLPPQIPSSIPEVDVVTALQINDESTTGVDTALLLSNSESRDVGTARLLPDKCAETTGVQTANLLSDGGAETKDVKTATLIGETTSCTSTTMTATENGEKKKEEQEEEERGEEKIYGRIEEQKEEEEEQGAGQLGHDAIFLKGRQTNRAIECSSTRGKGHSRTFPPNPKSGQQGPPPSG